MISSKIEDMPNLPSSKKALRQSIKRARANAKILDRIKKALKGSLELKKAQALIDKAAKKGILHANKAAHLKRALYRRTPKK